MTDVKAIADGLTEAQRNAVLRLLPHERMMGGYGENSGCPGLIQRCGIDHPLYGSSYRLTPLGLSVRAHMKGKRDDN